MLSLDSRAPKYFMNSAAIEKPSPMGDSILIEKGGHFLDTHRRRHPGETPEQKVSHQPDDARLRLVYHQDLFRPAPPLLDRLRAVSERGAATIPKAIQGVCLSAIRNCAAGLAGGIFVKQVDDGSHQLPGRVFSRFLRDRDQGDIGASKSANIGFRPIEITKESAVIVYENSINRMNWCGC